MEPGETLLGLDLAHGGHLTHGMRLNFSGKLYENAFYGVSKEDFRIDMDEVRKIALDTKPKVIVARPRLWWRQSADQASSALNTATPLSSRPL